VPPPPEGSVRTRCYRLNLDAPVTLSAHEQKLQQDVEVGPIVYEPPMHLLPKGKQNELQKVFRNIIQIPSNDPSASAEDSKSSTEMAIDTALIFRHLDVDEKGRIINKNERATRSDERKEGKSPKNFQSHRKKAAAEKRGKINKKPLMKEIGDEIEEINSALDPSVVHYVSSEEKEDENHAEPSRQQMIIENARSAVDKADEKENEKTKEDNNKSNNNEKSQSPHNSNANNTTKQSSLSSSSDDNDSKMLSLVIIGEYNEFKHLVRDGVKNLHDAEGLPDEALLAINRPRSSNYSSTPTLTMSYSSSSADPNHPHHNHNHHQSSRDILHSERSVHTHERVMGPISSLTISGGGSSSCTHHIPKLKSHPRDRISTKV